MKALSIIICLAMASCMKKAYVVASVKDCRTGQTDTITVKIRGGMCIEDRGNGDSVLIDKVGVELRDSTCDFEVLKVYKRQHRSLK